MPQVSKYPVSSDIAERIFDIFIKSFINLRDKNETDDFISDLFSPTEKIMLAKRIAIAFLLLKDFQYREISKILRVSVTTVASVNLSLKHGKGSYKKILDKIMKEEKLEALFMESAEKLISIPAGATKGAGVYRYLRNEIKKSTSKKGSF
ncbi:MAG TPA: Trp family transcriptional regulator [Xanthomonadales bacterium]|nr:Trp family transcriptional regulator [Xanthomonadales bacterium]